MAATASSIWQRPFVDVFKLVGLQTGSWAGCEREGNVAQTLDKVIGKNVVRVSGAVATANKLVIPGKKHGGGLGLTGSFVYVQVRPLPHQLFTIIVEVMCKDGSATRITLSNMFRVPARRGARILVPLDLADEWYTVGLDIPLLLERFKDPARPSEYWCLKSVSVFAGVQVRNIFTAETPYRSTPDLAQDSEMASLEALPAALQMSRTTPNLVIWAPAVPHNTCYSSATSVPLRSVAAGSGGGLPSPGSASSPTTPSQTEECKSASSASLPRRDGQSRNAKKNSPPERRSAHRSGRKPSSENDARGSNARPPALAAASKTSASSSSPLPGTKARPPAASIPPPRPPPPPQHLPSSESMSRRAVPSSTRKVPALRPDPIMRMHTYVGHSCALDSAKPLWSRDGKHIIYASATNIIIGKFDNPRRQQRMLLGHTARVTCLALSADGALLASTQEGRNPVIRLWNPTSGKCASVLATSSGGGLRSLDFSADSKFLCAVGRDEHNRTQICVWNVSGLHTNHTMASTRTTIHQGGAQDARVSLVARQTSEFDIALIRFSPYDAHQLVSCGRENIRFWRIRNRHLPGTPVVLNEFARNANYTDMAFETAFGSSSADVGAPGGSTTTDKRVFVATNLGTVAAVHYERRTVLCIYRLHDGPIHALAVNEGFCVTASEDQHVRVWPLDFADFFLEARHESAVASVDVSADGLEILTSTTGGVLGVLNVSSHSHTVKMRAHGSAVSCVSFRAGPHGEIEMATASSDGTVRVWSVPGCEQMYEFLSEKDEALCCAYHPDRNQNLLVCGYRSGTLRVFDVRGTALVYEYKQHAAAVHGVGIHAQGVCTVTLGEDGHLCVYDSSQYYQPTKMIPLDEGGVPATRKTRPPRWSPKCLAMDPTGKLVAVVHPVRPEIVLVETDPRRQLVDFDVVLRIKRASSRGGAQDARFVSLAFSSDASELFASTADNRIVKYRILYSAEHGWDATLVRDTHSMHPASVSALALSPHGADYLATAGSDFMVQVWDARLRGTTPTLQRFIGHASEVLDANFSLDGRFLASVGTEQTMLLWEFHGQLSRDPFAPASLATETDVDQGDFSEYTPSAEETAAMRQAEAQGLSVTGTALSPAAVAAEDDGVDAQAWAGVASRPRPLCELGSASETALVAARCTASRTAIARIAGLNTASTSVMGWHPASGLFAYSCGRSLVFEDLESQAQQVFAKHESTVSAVTMGASGRLVASGAGVPTVGGAVAAGTTGEVAEIIIYESTSSDAKSCVRVTHVMVGHQHAGVQALQFSADEVRLASLGGAGNGMLCVWNTTHGTLESSHRLVDGIGYDLLWVSAEALATVGSCGQMALWRIPTEDAAAPIVLEALHVVARGAPANADLVCIARAPKWLTRAHGADAVFAIGDTQGQVRVLALPERVELASWQAAEDEVTALAWCDKHLVVGVRSGVVVLWDVGERYPDAGQIPAHVFSYKDPILDLCWQAQGNDGLVVTAGAACVYTNVESQQLVPLVRGSRDAIGDLCCSADGSLVVSCMGAAQQQGLRSQGTARVWEPRTLELLAQIGVAGDDVSVHSVALLAPPGETPAMCALACSDGSVRVVDFVASAPVSNVQVLDGAEALVSVRVVGDHIVAASERGDVISIRVDYATGALDTASLATLVTCAPGVGRKPAQLYSDPRVGDLLAITDCTGRIAVHHLGNPEIAAPLFSISSLKFAFASFSTEDPDRLVCATARSVAQVDVGATEIALSGEVPLPSGERITALAGDYVGTDRGRVLRFDVASNALDVVYDGHGTAVSALECDAKRGVVLSAAGHELVSLRHEAVAKAVAL